MSTFKDTIHLRVITEAISIDVPNVTCFQKLQLVGEILQKNIILILWLNQKRLKTEVIPTGFSLHIVYSRGSINKKVKQNTYL